MNKDEDGFHHRVTNNKVDDITDKHKQTNSGEPFSGNNKKISSYSTLSKDVQFLLKVKRYRKKKENEDMNRTSGF